MAEHVMLDLETLGMQTNSFILSIGACVFTNSLVGNTLHSYVNDVAGCVDLTTILWWLKQSDEARAAQADAQRIPAKDALEQLVEWVGHRPVWGNGASFDLTIVRAACERHGIKCWNPWQDRCYRTWKQLHPKLEERSGVHHNALDDAISQAMHMIQHGGF